MARIVVHELKNWFANKGIKMSQAWEATSEDVGEILNQHDLFLDEQEVFDEHVKCESTRIEKSVLYYDDFHAQCEASLSEIEDILIEKGVISGEKQFGDEQ